MSQVAGDISVFTPQHFFCPQCSTTYNYRGLSPCSPHVANGHSPPGKREAPYLSEGGREAFDQLYRLWEGEMRVVGCATPSPLLPPPLDSQTQLVGDLLNVLIGVASTTFPLNQVRPHPGISQTHAPSKPTALKYSFIYSEVDVYRFILWNAVPFLAGGGGGHCVSYDSSNASPSPSPPSRCVCSLTCGRECVSRLRLR